jgi:hypothetical protein
VLKKNLAEHEKSARFKEAINLVREVLTYQKGETTRIGGCDLAGFPDTTITYHR